MATRDMPIDDVPEMSYWAPEWIGIHKSAWQDGVIQFDRLVPGGANMEVLQSMIDAELAHNELGQGSEDQETEAVSRP